MTTAVQPQYAPAPPPKKSHTLRNILIGVLVLFFLLVGGCMAIVGMAANEVDKSIKKGESEAGGTENPIAITVGKPFEVRGLNYQDGWGLKNAFGSMEVTKLRVENNRKDSDAALVEIKVWKGKEVVAMADCSTNMLQPGTVAKLDCISTDKLPRKYSKVTINDSF